MPAYTRRSRDCPSPPFLASGTSPFICSDGVKPILLTGNQRSLKYRYHFFARSRAAEAHRSAVFARPTAFLLRRRGLLSSHRLSLRSFLTSTASAPSAAKTVPKVTRSSTDTIGL